MLMLIPKNGNMDKFLSDTMVILNSYPSFDSREIKRLIATENLDIMSVNQGCMEYIEEIFHLAMMRAVSLFGKHAFRKSYGSARKLLSIRLYSKMVQRFGEDEPGEV